jgi:hypothetical protein
MGRIADREKAQKLLSTLADAGFGTVVTAETDGTEIQFGPTDDLIAAAILVAQAGCLLHYDGRRVRVIEQTPELPTVEVVNEQDAIEGKIDARTWTLAHDDEVITEEAAALALSYGLKVDDLVKQKVGTGKDGRITKTDITTYVRGIV